MRYNKKYQGNLYIDEKYVYLNTNIKFKTLSIKHLNILNIKNTQNLNIFEGDNKIIIANLGDNKIDINKPLFEYVGRAIITECKIFDLARNENILRIHKTSLELWNTLGQTQGYGDGNNTVQDWAYISRNWEDIDFDGNNSKKPYIFKKTTYDNETKAYITTKQIRKK